MVDGENIRVTAVTRAHSQSQHLFGANEAEQVFRFSGHWNGNQISGQAEDGKGQNSVTLRGTRLGDLTA